MMRLACSLALVLVACGSDAHGTSGDASPGDDGDVPGDDGGDDGGIPVTCGGETCRADQACVADTCTFACTGSQVPGDYATVDAAAFALRDVPASVLCLGPQAYPVNNLILADDLTIIGVSASKTALTSAGSIITRGHVTFKGVTLDAHLDMDGLDSTTTVIGAKVTRGIEIQRTRIGGPAAGHKGILDGVDVAGGIWLRDALCNQCTGTVELELRNSYVHDAANCLRYDEGSDRTPFVIHAINNTIVGCENGIIASTQPSASGPPVHTIDLRNNIVANHTIVGITTPTLGSMNSSSTFITGNNALWGNATNYADGAVDGPGYVKQDCALSTSVPPSLGASSPCRGAADATAAPPTDFFGHPRTAPFDIGAL